MALTPTVLSVVLILLVTLGQASSPVKVRVAGSSTFSPLAAKLAQAFKVHTDGRYEVDFYPMLSDEARCRLNEFTGSYCSRDSISDPREVDAILVEGLFPSQDYVAMPDLQLYPVLAQAVVAVFNVPNVTQLRMDSRALARIYREVDRPGATPPPVGAPSQIYRWNDSQITTANPTFAAQLREMSATTTNIIRYVRADISGTTELFKWGITAADQGTEEQFSGANFTRQSAAEWDRIMPRTARSEEAMATFIKNTPGSIGYMTLQGAKEMGMNIVANSDRSILQGGGFLNPTVEAIEQALLINGENFGNFPGFDTSPSRLTANLVGNPQTSISGANTNNLGTEAWPIVGYVYFGVRKNSTNCTQARKGVYRFLDWMYRSETATTLLQQASCSPVLPRLRTELLDRFSSSFRCENDLVSSLVQQEELIEVGPSFSEKRHVILSTAGAEEGVSRMLRFTSSQYGAGRSGLADVQISDNATNAKLQLRWMESPASTFGNAQTTSIPFFRSAWGITYNLGAISNLTLTKENVRDILIGAISTWGTLGSWTASCPKQQKTRCYRWTTDPSTLSFIHKVPFLQRSPMPFLPLSCNGNLPLHPQGSPTNSLRPTASPTRLPSETPTKSPILTKAPSKSPTRLPSRTPTRTTTQGPSRTPTTSKPTSSPSTPQPTASPTTLPSISPTLPGDTLNPSSSPSSTRPSRSPTLSPTRSSPTRSPRSSSPSRTPTMSKPTFSPTTTAFGYSFVTDSITRARGYVASTAFSLCLAPLFDATEFGLQIASILDPLNMTTVPFNSADYPLHVSYAVEAESEFSTQSCLDGSAQETALFVDFALINSQGLLNSPYFSVVLPSANASEAVATLQCFGKSITAPPVDLRLVPYPLIWTIRVAGLALIAACICLMIWILFNRKIPVLMKASPIFLEQMLLGCIIITLTLFPLSIQESDGVLDETLDSACAAVPWLVSLGFVFMYAPLFAKTWRLARIFNNPRMQKVRIKNFQLLLMEMAAIIPTVIILIAWQVDHPMRWERNPVLIDTTTFLPIATEGACVSETASVYAGLLVALAFGNIVIGSYLAYIVRNLPTDFSEGKHIAAVMAMLLESFILGIPVIVLAAKNPTASFVVKVMFILRTSVATVFIFFGPKMAVQYGWWTDSAVASTQKPGTNSQDKQEQTHTHRAGSPSNSHMATVDNNQALASDYSLTRTSVELQQMLDDPKQRAKLVHHFKGTWAESATRFLDTVNSMKNVSSARDRREMYDTITKNFLQAHAPLLLLEVKETERKILSDLLTSKASSKKSNLGSSTPLGALSRLARSRTATTEAVDATSEDGANPAAEQALQRVYQQVMKSFGATVQFQEFLENQIAESTKA